MAKQLPLSCPGHTRPVVHLGFSNITVSGGYFLITACKGKVLFVSHCAFITFTTFRATIDETVVLLSCCQLCLQL